MPSVRLQLPLFTSRPFIRNLYTQDIDVPDSIPCTRESFEQSETFVLEAIDWLETTPVSQKTERRKLLEAYMTAWLTQSPTVNIDLNAKIMPYNKKNLELVMVFMSGWTRYALQHDYTRDPVPCNLAGLRSVIKVYNANVGRGIRKDKAVEHLVDLERKGMLEDYVRLRLQ
ncbi:hypothetical protein [Dinghuibacter silviterrae]|uniref:Uncharacterized protein n=1 Tax=Dinghuibacter silviterrae TaxID=1539049 RepID=A0A4V3GM50_9BACT|nr:hypothetical protein [Dinghuibacter silviterrae]TDX02093.1 hypothetical protein EDB95_3143 [Dinghuibacter silviterrae]